MSADLILSIPAFFRTAQGTYWHRPRSATSQLYGWCFTAWCGATTRGGGATSGRASGSARASARVRVANIVRPPPRVVALPELYKAPVVQPRRRENRPRLGILC